MRQLYTKGKWRNDVRNEQKTDMFQTTTNELQALHLGQAYT